MPPSRRLRAARFSAALALLPLPLAAPSALAQPNEAAGVEPSLRLSWESDDPACSGSDVSARALQLVSPGVVPRPLRARVEVRREAEQWLVRLQTVSGDKEGRRILRAESCAELERAIALLLAMAMESRGDVLPPEPPAAPGEPVVAPPPPPPARSPPPRETPSGVQDAPPAPIRTEPGAIELGWFARLDGKVANGLQPGVGLGMGLVAGIRLGDLDLGLSGAFWPQTTAAAANREGRVSVTRQDVGLRACWNVRLLDSLVLAPCLNPELTFFRYVSEDFRVETRRDTKGPAASLSGAADLRYELIERRLSLLLSPGVTWQRPQPFQLQLVPLEGEPAADDGGSSEVYTTARFGPRLEVGVDARF